ncbi:MULTISPECIES: hypothetical protein [unclassified Microcoleus]
MLFVNCQRTAEVYNILRSSEQIQKNKQTAAFDCTAKLRYDRDRLCRI